MPPLDRLKTGLEPAYGRLDTRLAGRLSLLERVALAYNRHEGPLVARSIAYYALFAVIPAILALAIVAGMLLDSHDAQSSLIRLLERTMPVLTDLVSANIDRLFQMHDSIGVIALAGLLWAASGVFSAIFQAVNRAWGIPPASLALTSRLWGLAMMCLVGGFFLVTLSIGPLISLAQAWQPPLPGWVSSAGPSGARLLGWFSALAPALVAMAAFTLMYRFLPRARVRWRDVWLGGVLAGLIWDAGKELFVWYVSNVATYSLIYGSMAAIIVFLLWCYFSAQILLLGAEFTAEYSRWRREGRPVEKPPVPQPAAGGPRPSA